MTIRDLRPLDVEPVAIRPPYDQRCPRDLGARVVLATMRADYVDALFEPLAGIALGGYDRRLIAWIAGWDIPTIGGVASLLHRARAAAPLDTPTRNGEHR